MIANHSVPWAALALLASCAGAPTSPGGAADAPADESTPDDDDSTSFECPRPISTAELEAYRSYFPTTRCGTRVDLSEGSLPADDIESGNTTVEVLHDEDGAVLGLARTIFTPVDCAAGVCEAIRFVLVFEADTEFLDVFHPTGSPNELKKYWQDTYLTFTDDDMDLLRAQLNTPPATLLAAPDNDALVEGTNGTAPTLPEYQPFVVRGAAFTCYMILNYMLETQDLLNEVLDSLERSR